MPPLKKSNNHPLKCIPNILVKRLLFNTYSFKKVSVHMRLYITNMLALKNN